jgi:hypothetical protein
MVEGEEFESRHLDSYMARGGGAVLWRMTSSAGRLSLLSGRAEFSEIKIRASFERIARTIEGLRAHNARHRAAGHGFAFTVVDGAARRLPVIAKSYHKINTGPFVRADPVRASPPAARRD